MENITEPNESFDFSKLSLAHPTGIQGGAYFTKIQYNDKPLYIQTPKGLTKQGFIKNGKKMYADLMFDNNNDVFIHWLENLETKCQELIFAKGDVWFEHPLDKNDIETAFASPMRIYKSGKFYLVRVNIKVNSTTNVPNIKIYDENETALTLEDISLETKLISIIEIQGIKFTSRNFQIEIEIKQIMTMATEVLFDNCLIKPVNKAKSLTPTPEINTVEPTINVKEETKNEILAKVVERNTINGTAMLKNLENLSEQIMKNENDIKKNAIIEDEDEDEDSDDDNEYEEDDSDDEKKPPIKLGNELTPSFKKGNNSEMPDLDEIEFNFSEDLLEKEKEKEKREKDSLENDILKEFSLPENLDSLESMTLKKPNQVYYEIYKQARKKAKQAKKDAIVAFLEAKNIKKTYLLNDLDESDDEEEDLKGLE